MSKVIQFPGGKTDAEAVFKSALDAGINQVLVVGFTGDNQESVFIGGSAMPIGDLLILQRYLADAIDSAWHVADSGAMD